MPRMRISIYVIIVLLAVSCVQKKAPTPEMNVPKKPGAGAVTKWNDQKYSMFIHFGLYSIPAGTWEGKPVTKGYSEQIRAHGQIPKEDYRALARQFNPTQWQADSVALLAKNAGMKSIVITAKHHDGFSLFDTAESEFNSVDATPYGKDILKGLAEACRKQGLNFGVYFSLIDWDHPSALPISDHNSDSIPPAHHQLNLKQVEELMTQYGPISEIWFDMGKPTEEQSRELVQVVREHQPNCLVSGRIWNDQGDFAVMGDNASPDFRMGTLWQTPASMFDETWGYRSWQERGDPEEKAREKLLALINVVSNGGNYLLNIGPRGDGSILPFEREVLMRIGQWLNIHGEAIYGSRPAPLQQPVWGKITSKSNSLYLFLTDTLVDGKLRLEGLQSPIRSARLLSDPGRSIHIDSGGGAPRLILPEMPADLMVPVVQLQLDGALRYSASDGIRPAEDGGYTLRSDNATKFHSYSGADYYSTKATVVQMTWELTEVGKENFELELNYSPEDAGKQLELVINGKARNIILGSMTENAKEGYLLKLGSIRLTPSQTNRIELQLADRENPHRDMGMQGIKIRLQ